MAFSIFSNFPELICGVSSRHFGDMRFGKIPDEEVKKNRASFCQELGIEPSEMVVPTLAHSVKIAAVGEKEKGAGAFKKETAIKNTDGLMTTEPGIYLMVTTADCLSILIYDPILKAVLSCHAGWRGISEHIASRAVEKLIFSGCDPENLIVGLGPSICQKHFVVKKDVLELFLESHPAVTFVRNNDGYVDLKRAVLTDFKKAGVPAQNIEVKNICPYCDNGSYGSFRKEGEAAPASAAIIGMREW